VLAVEPVVAVVGCPEVAGEKHPPEAVKALKFVALSVKNVAQKLSDDPANCWVTVFPVGVQIASAQSVKV